MDDVRIGRLLRALRRRRKLRQVDVAGLAGVSQSLISLVERGHLSRLSIDTVRRVFAAVEGRFEGVVSWRGGAIDRLLDERHAMLVGIVARDLQRRGWQVELEVTFNVYGDRGAIDILAVWPDQRLALVVEIKTEITSIEETLRRLDVKERLASRIVRDRLEWRVQIVSRLLVVLDTATNRRRVATHEASLTPAFRHRGVGVRQWLSEPSGRLSGLRFVPFTNPRGTRQPRGERIVQPEAVSGALTSRVRT